jgi:hypothetical protein
VNVGLLKALRAVVLAHAGEVSRRGGTARFSSAVGAQRAALGEEAVLQRVAVPRTGSSSLNGAGAVDLAARAPTITGGGIEALRASGEASPLACHGGAGDPVPCRTP